VIGEPLGAQGDPRSDQDVDAFTETVMGKIAELVETARELTSR
jgi:hypothetical protein